MIGKFQIACSFAVIYVYAGELMPTVVRSQVGEAKTILLQTCPTHSVAQAMGISSFVAGLGLLGFPYINMLVRKIGERGILTNSISGPD